MRIMFFRFLQQKMPDWMTVKDVLQEMLREDKIYIERVIPYAQAGVLQLVRNKGELVSEEYVPEGISIRAYVPMEVYGKL